MKLMNFWLRVPLLLSEISRSIGSFGKQATYCTSGMFIHDHHVLET